MTLRSRIRAAVSRAVRRVIAAWRYFLRTRPPAPRKGTYAEMLAKTTAKLRSEVARHKEAEVLCVAAVARAVGVAE